MRTILIWIIILSLTTVLNAQEEKKKESKNFLISPLLVPGYTPELGGLLAAGGLMSFKTNPKDTLIQRSSVPVTLAYTTTKAVVFQSIINTYWAGDKIRISGDFWYKDMPDHYWGVGYENGFNIPKSDSTTAYQRQWWWINPRIMWQFKKNFFLGLNIDFNYTKGSEESEGVANDPVYQEFNDKPFNSGLGLILSYDSRDIPVDTRSGFYVNLNGTFYGSYLGGDNQCQVYAFDYRQAETISRVGQTLAWQIKGRFSDGDVPYGEMSQLGTPFDLRGYQWGRFRDKSMLFFIAEYRHTFLKKSGELGKHGAVVWLGTGSVFNRDVISDNNLNWLPNFGVGYRYEIQPRMNLRLDLGIGRETMGVYFNFNQAF